jgi:DNA repair protein RadC
MGLLSGPICDIRDFFKPISLVGINHTERLTMPNQQHITEYYSQADILASAANILKEKFVNSPTFSSATETMNFLQFKLATLEHEAFCIMHLNSQHHLIEFEELFRGTVDSATVYPREVVKSVIANNSAAVILAHNHPSGMAEPSIADRQITHRLKDALGLIDVKVLDHIVVGSHCVSFAQRGML